MALITCPDCKKEISSAAKACPHCGCPLDQYRDTDAGRAALAQSKPPELITQAQGSIIVLILLLCLGLIGWQSFKPAPKWEYKIQAVPDITFDSEMNKLGSEGWELVFARRASNSSDVNTKPDFSYEMILKRPAK